MNRFRIPRKLFRRLKAEIENTKITNNGEKKEHKIFAKLKKNAAIIISILSVSISFFSLIVSYKNFQTASNSLRISNRAYVLVESVKLVNRRPFPTPCTLKLLFRLKILAANRR